MIYGKLVTAAQRDKTLWDVWAGKGWDRHSIFQVEAPNKIKFIGGFSLTADEFREFKGFL